MRDYYKYKKDTDFAYHNASFTEPLTLELISTTGKYLLKMNPNSTSDINGIKLYW